MLLAYCSTSALAERSPDWYRETRPRKTTTTSSSELKLQYPPTFTAKGLTGAPAKAPVSSALTLRSIKVHSLDCPAWVSPAAALMTR